MKLNLEDLKNRTSWEQAGIRLPSYDCERVSETGRSDPRWVHFGIGNIFRIFIGGIADRLLSQTAMDRGIICMEAYDREIPDMIYGPHDNLVLAVTLKTDGSNEKRVLAPFAEAVFTVPESGSGWERAKEVFRVPGLQMVSFTITEKGYALRNSAGEYTKQALWDLENGPDHVKGAMGIITALLLERFSAGGWPLALVSMDNVSRNGEKLSSSVLEIAQYWTEKGLAPVDFTAYLEDKNRIAFPWTMIDKITPGPTPDTAKMLAELGVEGMEAIETEKHTRIAPFANAEGPEYLVIEDSFPNGRPPLEKAGVYMTDRHTVNLCERMKVTACLNPIHTALAPYDRMLGYQLFADGMKDAELSALACVVGYSEGLPVVEDPGILSPKAFLDEVMQERFPNAYLGDTSQRICVDISQGVAFRFGETVRAYMERGESEKLIGIPLAIAGWMRYLLGRDDSGEPFELSPDPMIPELLSHLNGICWDDPDSLKDQLRPVLSNAALFGLDLYEAGIGEKIEELLREELGGKGAVRKTLKRLLSREG